MFLNQDMSICGALSWRLFELPASAAGPTGNQLTSTQPRRILNPILLSRFRKTLKLFS